MTSQATIAIIGAGGVGTTLGRRFASLGHPIIYGARDLAKASESIVSHPGSAKVASVADAAAAADVIILAVPGNAAVEAAAGLSIDGKILVDATVVPMPLKLTFTRTQSALASNSPSGTQPLEERRCRRPTPGPAL